MVQKVRCAHMCVIKNQVGKWAVVCAGKACMGERCIPVPTCTHRSGTSRRCKWRDAKIQDTSGACAHYTFIQHVPCKNKHNHDICIKTSVLIPCCQMGCMFCINFVTSDSLLKLIVCIVYCFLRSGGKKLGNVSMLIKTVSF